MPPLVIIHANSNLDSFYNSIQEMMNARYHQPGNSFPDCSLTPGDLADQAALAAYASAAGAGYTKVDDLHVRCPDGSVVHIERLIR